MQEEEQQLKEHNLGTTAPRTRMVSWNENPGTQTRVRGWILNATKQPTRKGERKATTDPRGNLPEENRWASSRVEVLYALTELLLS